MAAGHATTSGAPPTARSAEVYAPTAKNATTPRFTSPVSPHCTLSPSVSRARTPTSVAIAVRYAITSRGSRSRPGEARRPQEQHRDDDGEADRGLVRRRDHERADLFHDADDQRSGQRPWRRPDAAENGRGEDRDDQTAAHQRIDARVEADEHTGAAGQRAAAERRARDHALGRHALD